MKAGKITAKLRDAVKVCFMVEGKEVKRYKNIEMPDALKELEIRDFHFNVLTDGKIEFWLHFDRGILPEEWPECRERKHRGDKTDEPVAGLEAAPEADEPVTEPEIAPVVDESVAGPEVALKADIAPAVKEPAKRGRKPGKRTNPETQPEDVAI